MSKADKEKELEIINCYQNDKTLSYRDISNMFNISPETSRKILLKYNIPKNKKQFKVAKNLIGKDIIDFYLLGNGLISTASKFGVSYFKIKDILNQNNIHIRSYKESIGLNKGVRTKYKINESFFDNPDKWGEAQAWFLGWLAADGNNYSPKNSFFIKLHEKDKCILEKLKSLIEYEGPLIYRDNKKDNIKNNTNNSNAWILQIRNRKLSQALYSLGIVDNKSLIYEFPKYLKPELVRHFIRGYFEGDGCITFIKKDNLFRFIQLGTYKFLESFNIELNKHLGIKIKKIRLHINNPKHKHYNGITSDLIISGQEELYKLYYFMYEDAKYILPRKKEKFDLFVDQLISKSKYSYLNPAKI